MLHRQTDISVAIPHGVCSAQHSQTITDANIPSIIHRHRTKQYK